MVDTLKSRTGLDAESRPVPRLKYADLIDRLRKRAALANEINEHGLESDLLDAADALTSTE